MFEKQFFFCGGCVNEEQVPLMEAARVLRIGYSRALQLVLTGQLAGEQKYGRWLVDSAALRLAQKKAAKKTQAASE